MGTVIVLTGYYKLCLLLKKLRFPNSDHYRENKFYFEKQYKFISLLVNRERKKIIKDCTKGGILCYIHQPAFWTTTLLTRMNEYLV